MPTVELNITSKDIKNGVRGEGDSCPIARAALKAGFTGVNVDDTLAFDIKDPVYGTDEVYLSLPKKALKFIENFDEGKTVKPFKLRLRIKQALLSLLNIRKRYLVTA